MGTDIETGLRTALRTAMKAKDTVAASALRSALAAIANAEAVPPAPETVTAPSQPASQHVAGGTAGLGSAETERRRLTRDETDRIVRGEISDREAAARQYEAAGRPDRADRLRREAQAIRAALEA